MANIREHKFEGWDNNVRIAKKAKSAKAALTILDGAADRTRVSTFLRTLQFRVKEGIFGVPAIAGLAAPVAAEALYLTQLGGSLSAQFGDWKGFVATGVGGAIELTGGVFGLLANRERRVVARMKKQLHEVEAESVQLKEDELQRRIATQEQMTKREYTELKKQATKRRRFFPIAVYNAGRSQATSGVTEIRGRIEDVVSAVKGK